MKKQIEKLESIEIKNSVPENILLRVNLFVVWETKHQNVRRHLCWLTTLRVTQVKSETGPGTQRARKDVRKSQTTADWEAAGLISKKTYTQGLA